MDRRERPRGRSLAVLIVVSALTALLGVVEQAAAFLRNEFYQEVAATSSNTALSFGFNATSVLFINDGTNDARVTVKSSTATTSKLRLKSGEHIEVRGAGMEGAGIICAGGETATVRVYAVEDRR